jgi:hypothetical protein
MARAPTAAVVAAAAPLKCSKAAVGRCARFVDSKLRWTTESIDARLTALQLMEPSCLVGAWRHCNVIALTGMP